MLVQFFRKNPLYAAFIVIFIDFLAIGLTIPILPPLFKDEARNIFESVISQESREVLYGFLVGLFFLSSFFGAPILGALSDKFGRKKLLFFTTSFTIIAYLLIAVAIYVKEVSLIFVARIVSGFAGIIIIVINSAIADISTRESKARNFGLTGVAFGVGFIVGPALGGILANPEILPWFGYPLPYFTAAGLLFFNLLFVYFLFPETNKKLHAVRISLFSGFNNIKKAWSHPGLRAIFTVIFVLALGFSFFTQFFPIYLINKFDYDQTQIGYIFAWTGLWVVIAQGILLRPLSRRFTPSQTLVFSIPLFAISYLLLLIPNESYYIYLVVPLMALFQGFTFPNSVAIVSNMADEHIQGEIIGINQSVQSLAAAVPPILFGFAVAFHQSFTLVFGASCTFIAWFIFLVYFRNQKGEKRET